MFNPAELEKKKGFDPTPRCFLLEPVSLRLRLTECRDSIVHSFRAFPFDTYNPVIVEVFGEAYVVDPGSGVEAWFPPRKVGRPKKKLAAMKDSKASEAT